jgi:hypothetical protein
MKMMKNNKNQCSNVSTESYTGKEQSPKRFGLSAEGFDINFEKEGFDKLIWVVQVKNNRKVWVRKNNITTITHEEPIIPDKSIESGITEIKNDEVEVQEEEIKHKEMDVAKESKPKTDEETTSKPEKKKTDYNIFLTFYLAKLKGEEANKSIPHKDILKMATIEWARLKENPTELKILIENIKK